VKKITCPSTYGDVRKLWRGKASSRVRKMEKKNVVGLFLFFNECILKHFKDGFAV
jgi:hypothetical protein